MLPEDEIKTLTIDGEVYNVDDMPDNVKAAVRLYGDWRQRHQDAVGEVHLFEAALRDLGAGIVAAVKEHEASLSQDEDANAAPAVDPTPAPVVEAPADSSGPVDSAPAAQVSGETLVVE